MGKANHPIYGRPGHLIRRLHQIAVAIFMSETKNFNITPVQYSALLAVDLHPGIDQTTLVNTIAFDRSTIGSVVSRLESKKWIKRVSGERRSKRLTITPAGRKVLREIDATVDRSQKLILAPLALAEQPAFVEHAGTARETQQCAQPRAFRRRSSRRTPEARPTASIDQRG